MDVEKERRERGGRRWTIAAEMLAQSIWKIELEFETKIKSRFVSH